LGNRRLDKALHLDHGVRVLVGVTGPKEAPQSILSSPGDDVDVKVGDALADAVVDGDEGAFRPQPALNRLCEQLNVSEEGWYKAGREIPQGLMVVFGD
jgi:hypothetical protein